MTDLEDRLRQDLVVLARQMPANDMIEGSVRRGEQRQLRRRSILAMTGVAVMVAAIVLPLTLLGSSHRSATTKAAATAQPLAHRYASVRPHSLLAAGPRFFTYGFGGQGPFYAKCPLTEIHAAAHLVAAPPGVLGVVALHGHRCRLSPSTTPTLLNSDGRAIPAKVDNAADSVNPAGYPVPEGNFGKASFGFTWRGSWCGRPAAAVRVTFPNGRLIIPVSGKSLPCNGRSDSQLIPGVIGPIHQGVQAASPEWSQLTTSLVAAPRTRGLLIHGLAVTFHNPTSSPIELSPTPIVSVDLSVESVAAGGLLGRQLSTTVKPLVVPSEGDVTVHLPDQRYDSPTKHEFRGTNVTLTFSMPGVPSATTIVRGT